MQNVRNMNFFSIFVNNAVDDNVEKEGFTSKKNQANVIENFNRDNKEIAEALISNFIDRQS